MHHGGIYEEEIAGKVYDSRLLKRFASYVRPYRKPVLIVLLVVPLVAACRLAQPWIIKQAIDGHIITGKLAGLETLSLMFLGLLLVESILSYLEAYLLQQVGQRVMADIRGQLYRHLLALPASWFDRAPSGSVVTRLTSDVEVLGEMFAAGIITIVGDVLMLVGIVSVMLWMDVRLSLVTFSVLPVLVYVAWTFRQKMRSSFREVRASLGRLNGFLAESIAGISIIQMFNRQREEARRFSELNGVYRDANMPVILWDASLYALVEALSSIAVALILWYGGGEIVKGTVTFGVLVAFIQYIEKFFAPIRDLSAKFSIMQGAMAALERIFSLLDTPTGESSVEPEIARAPVQEQSGPQSSPPVPLIEFKQVSFSYRREEPVLSGFSLKVHQGERVALVGESGGGKTTITRLLTRLYPLDQGSILLGGIPLEQIPPERLRTRIGLILQDPCLFSGTIAFNIHLGDPSARERMERAAQAVGADRFIEALPDRYEHQVMERGSNFSGGEKQLISFARALAYDPEILILDEATAGIDSASEQMIQEGIRELMRGRTSLVIAHRLSTIRDADRIVVIHRGRGVEEGTHQQLMDLKGVYYRLHSLQFGGTDKYL